jgi:hypothetical protein
MSTPEIPLSKREQLYIAIAQGKSAAAWARENNVPRSTAYSWADTPVCRRLVDDRRRRSLKRVINCMSRHSLRVAKLIIELGETAESESVKLSALRAVLADQVSIAKYANLGYRVSQLEEQERARLGNANCPT